MTLEDYLTHRRISYRLIARYFLSDGCGTIAQMAKAMSADRTGARNAVLEFASYGLVHLVYWSRPSTQAGYVANYKAGYGEDAPKPAPLTKPQKPRAKKPKKEALPIVVREPEPFDEHWIHMMQALVPRRSMEQVREINQRYAEYMGAR